MDCVNHTGVEAKAFCQNCGKALCATCVRNLPGGQVLCEPCYVSWQGLQQPFVAPQPGAPNPILAAVLGVIPGVGAMYNGQIIKGLIHVVIFAVLVNMADHFGIFGLFIAAWVLYQVFDAYHTAAARRDGLPLPDPLGLNEAANWFNFGQRPPNVPPAPGAAVPPAAPYGGAPGAAGYTPPQTGPYAAGFTPVAGYSDPAIPPIPPIPPVPPVPPVYWKRKEPIGAIILIGLGIILLMNQMGFVTERLWGFAWPLMFIALGAWLFVRRMGDGPKGDKQ